MSALWLENFSVNLESNFSSYYSMTDRERETERQGERERICRVFSRQQLPEAYYEVEGKNQNLPR